MATTLPSAAAGVLGAFGLTGSSVLSRAVSRFELPAGDHGDGAMAMMDPADAARADARPLSTPVSSFLVPRSR